MTLLRLAMLFAVAPSLSAQVPAPAPFPLLSRPEAHHVVKNECVWVAETASLVSGEFCEDGPHRNNGIFWGLVNSSEADARAEAFGMELWADGYAYDELYWWTATATTSAMGTGRIRLYVIPGCNAPSPRMTIDWKPKFKLRAEVKSHNAEARVAGAMAGACDALDAKVDINGAVERASATVPSGATVTIVFPGLILQAPLTFQTGVGATEQPYSDYVSKYKFISDASCFFRGQSQIYVSANDLSGRAECHARCFDSKAGLDLDGVCQNCLSHSYIVYGWY